MFFKKRKVTDFKRWSEKHNLLSEWDNRTIFMTSLLRPESSILDIGCGKQIAKQHLPDNCIYTPLDLVKRSDDTIVHDFNSNKILELQNIYDYSFCSGVVEYIHDLNIFLEHLCRFSKNILLSYNSRANSQIIKERVSLGWMNHLSDRCLLNLFNSKNLTITKQDYIHNQLIFLLKVNPSKYLSAK